jgi:hypothetical protein
MTYFPPGGSGQPPGWGYQGQAPGYPAPRQRVRPGRAWYLVALGIFVAGVAWLVVGLVSLVGTINDLQRVPLPSGGTVSLTHSGGYTIYYEGPGAQTGDIPDFHINVAAASNGAAVGSLTRYGSNVTYSVGSHQGRAVLSFQVRSPGQFKITATGAPAGADLAFGGSIGGGIASALLPAIPLIALGFLAALVLLVVRIIVTRSGRQRYS